MKLYFKPILLSGISDEDDPGLNPPGEDGSRVNPGDDTIGDETGGGRRAVNFVNEVFDTLSADSEPVADIMPDISDVGLDVVPEIEIPTVDIPMG